MPSACKALIKPDLRTLSIFLLEEKKPMEACFFRTYTTYMTYIKYQSHSVDNEQNVHRTYTTYKYILSVLD